MRRTKTLPGMLLLCSLAAAARAGAEDYVHLGWIARVKPSVSPGQVVVMEKYVAVAGAKNVLYVFDREHGGRQWTYAFDGDAKLYAAGDSMLYVLSGRILHRLDAAEKRRVWSVYVGDVPLGAIAVDAEQEWTFVRDGGKRCLAVSPAGTVRNCDAKMESKAHVIYPAEFGATVSDKAGSNSTLVIHGSTVTLNNMATNRVAWRLDAGAPLVNTGGALEGKLFLLTEDGKMLDVNLKTGKKISELDLTQTIRMKLWDERPEDIDNYGGARLEAVDGHLYLAVGSAVAELSVKPFPAELSLKKSENTMEWALKKSLEQWDAARLASENRREDGAPTDFAAALRSFQDIVQAYPNSAPARMFLGMAYSSTGQTEKAVAELESAYRLEPENVDVISNLAGNYLVKVLSLDPKGGEDKIVELWEKMLRVQPETPSPYVGLAEMYLSRHRNADAEDVARRAAAAGFFGEDMFLLNVCALYLDRRHEEALGVSAQGVALFPDSRILHALRGKIFFKRGRYRMAVQELQGGSEAGGTRLQSTFPRLLAAGADYYLGTALGMAGRYKEALQTLRKSLKRMPTDAWLDAERERVRNLMQRAQREGEAARDEAQRAGKNLLAAQAEADYLAPVLMSLAQFALRAGDHKSAAAWLNRLDAMGEKDMETKSYLGYFYLLAGARTDVGGKYIKQAYESNPEEPVFMKNHAMWLWKMKKDFIAAEAMYRKAIAKNVTAEFLHCDYGTMLLAQRRNSEAAEQFRLELRHSPDSAAAKEGLKMAGGGTK